MVPPGLTGLTGVTSPPAGGQYPHEVGPSGDASRTDGGSDEERLGWQTVLLVVGLVVAVHAISPSVQVGDSRLSVATATSVAREQDLSLNEITAVTELTDEYDVREVDGRLLPFFPWPPMLLAMPGSGVADLLGRDPAELKPSDPNQTWIVELPSASVLVGVTAGLLMLLVFEVSTGSVERRRRSAVAGALVFAFATGAWSTGSRALWQHTPSMLCLVAALLAARRLSVDGDDVDHRWAYGLGLAIGLGYAMRPTNVVVLVVLVGWVALTRRSSLLRVLMGGALVAVPFVVVNVAAYGAVLPPYYAGTRLGTEAAIGFWEAAAMHVVSPSRGLLIYNPIVLLAAAGVVIKVREHRWTSLDTALVMIVGGYWVVIAGYGSTGGSSYGARMWTDVLPVYVYLAVPVLGVVRRAWADRRAPPTQPWLWPWRPC